MVNLSKSKYCALWQCPKMLWLRKYKPELAEVDSHNESQGLCTGKTSEQAVRSSRGTAS